jgi:flagellar biosynthesis/type III secretory pathway chaperone
MGAWAQDLLSILEKEESLLSRISDEARLKTAALKTGDIAGLDKIVNIEQPLSLQLAAAEQKRRALLEGNGKGTLTLSEVAGLAGDEYRDKLKEQLKSLTRVTMSLKRVNALNIELTRSRLEFYNYLRGPGRAVYENDGRVREAVGSTGIIDRKA